MENQIYRIKMSDNKSLEIYICDTNEVEPYKKIKDIGIVLLGKDTQFDGSLNSEELSSLIKYLEDCKEYIDEYNSLSSKQTVQKQRPTFCQLCVRAGIYVPQLINKVKADYMTTNDNNSSSQHDAKLPVSRRSDAIEWWDKVDRFAMLKKYGYQDEKKPWKYRPLTDKGIYLMWCRENGG